MVSSSPETPRIKSRLLVDSLVRQADIFGYAAYVERRGYDEGGIVIVKINKPNRMGIIYTLHFNEKNERVWHNPLLEKLAEDRINAYIKRTVDVDPDCWVIEIDDNKDTFTGPKGPDFWG